MVTATTVEERLANLEREVAEIRRLLGKEEQSQNWVERVLGSMEKYPDFQEVLRLGQEFRRSCRPNDPD